jgi:mannose-1-phosphate guanylyltransferase
MLRSGRRVSRRNCYPRAGGGLGSARVARYDTGMASAIVLCAGFGTRLRPLTDELPKPLVPVGDRSILEHALERLFAAGFGEVVINVHHLAALFERSIAHLAMRVRVVVEPDIRGTAGGVAGARALLQSDPVLVWNGDILVDPPLDQLVAGSEPHSFCLGVAPRGLGEGTVGLDQAGNVVRLRGERFGDEARGADYIGVLALGAAVRDSLPEHGCLFGDAALPSLRKGGVIRSAVVTQPWTDAGDLGSLLRANLAWLAARGLRAFVADSAQVAAAATVRDSVVGAGARVLGQGLLERCVVCPGATATAPLYDVIVAPSGRVIPAHV